MEEKKILKKKNSQIKIIKPENELKPRKKNLIPYHWGAKGLIDKVRSIARISFYKIKSVSMCHHS